MTRLQSAPFAKDLQTLCRLGAVGGLGDGELLTRFLDGKGDDRELAFAALIDRHGPMVLRVCLGVLKDRHDAEDAAQASFLILARRARSIRRPDSLGPWLHGVALRTASRARAEGVRRREVEHQVGEEVAMRGKGKSEFQHDEALHEEIDRLPARYKAAVVACDLEGLTHAQAAERLRLPVRTLETRLYRGRDRLRAKLVRRGVGLAAVEAVLSVSKPAEAALSVAFKEATARAAVCVLEGASPVASGLVAERVLAWSQSLASGKISALASSALVLLTSSGLLIGGAALASRKPDEPPIAKAPAQPDRKADAPNPLVRPMPNPEEIKQVLREASDDAITLSHAHPVPGSSALLMIARVQNSAGDADGALKSLRAADAESKGRKLANPLPSWPCRIAGPLASLGRKDEALNILQEAVRAVPKASANLHENYDSAFKLSEIAGTQLQVGDAEHARETVKLIETIAADALNGKAGERGGARLGGGTLLRQLAGAQVMVGDLDGAFSTLDQAMKTEADADENRKLILPMIAQASRQLDPAATRRVVDRMRKEIETAKTPEAKWLAQELLVGPLTRLGDVAEARRLAHEVATAQGGGPDAMARKECTLLEQMVYVQQTAGDLAGARESLMLAYETIRGHADALQGSNDRWRIAAGLSNLGDLEGALRMLETLKPGQVGGELLPLLTWRLAVEGKTDRALEALDKARKGVEADENDPSADRYHAMFALVRKSAVQALAGEVEPALASAQLIPDPTWRTRTLAGIVRARAQAGDVREALKLAQSFDAPDDSRTALEHLAMGVGSRLKVEADKAAPAAVKPEADRDR